MSKISTLIDFCLFVTRVVLTGYARMLGQSPMPSQQILALIAGMIHGRPVLDVMQDKAREVSLAHFLTYECKDTLSLKFSNKKEV